MNGYIIQNNPYDKFHNVSEDYKQDDLISLYACKWYSNQTALIFTTKDPMYPIWVFLIVAS